MVPSTGEATVMAGGTELLFTVRDTVVLFPAASVATTAMMFVPSVNEKEYENTPEGFAETVVPFIVIATAVESWTVPSTKMDASLVVVPSMGDETESVGAVASFLTVRVTVEEFPAASVAITVIVLIPSTSVYCVLNVPVPPMVTGAPFIVRVTAVESWTEPATEIAA